MSPLPYPKCIQEREKDILRGLLSFCPPPPVLFLTGRQGFFLSKTAPSPFYRRIFEGGYFLTWLAFFVPLPPLSTVHRIEYVGV